ncbi:MAG: type II toxin-antitoxin system HipA family toxin, partial [bacterium]
EWPRRLATLPPWLTNLLPEQGSPFRRRAARAAGLAEDDAFGLLAAVGGDMLGAITAVPTEAGAIVPVVSEGASASGPLRLRHSLPGMQLKFSVDRTDRLVLPADGRGGKWILKVPSRAHSSLARAELAAMLWARAVGFTVPDVEVVDPATVEGLAADAREGVPEALIVRRFDRQDDGSPVHMEEVAAALGVHPEDKYCDDLSGPHHSLVTIGRLLHALAPQDGGVFFRRVIFDVLVGNGDAHLKNWALLYPDGHKPRLAPAYDIVPTILYGDHDLALGFAGGKSFHAVDRGRIRQYAAKIKADPDGLEATARELVEAALDTFSASMREAGLGGELVGQLVSHHRQLPVVRDLLG